MKHFSTLLVFCMLFSVLSNAQINNSFKYQAILRDNQGNTINNEQVGIRISIIASSTDGPASYIEEHTVTTNALGLVHLNIGEGDVQTGTFSEIDWSSDGHDLQIEIDRNNSGYTSMGITPLLSVPYALHAQTVADNNDADADPKNEIQTLSISNDTLFLSEGGAVKISSISSDYNSLINVPVNMDTNSTDDFSGDFLDLTNKPTLALQGTRLAISGGNAIDIGVINNTDTDATNELQELSISGDTLQLNQGGGSIKLPAKVLGSDGNEVLFCVLNNNDDTVFAVYEGAVRVYVDEAKSKAAKGGFAVATRNSLKGDVNDILNVTSDSVRIYIDETTKDKAAKGGFAVATRNSVKGSADVLSVSSESTSVYIGDADQGFNVVNTGNASNESLLRLTEENYLMGHNSGASISNGMYNLFLGYESGFSNTNAGNNTFLGYKSGRLNTTGASNVFIGNSTGMSSTNSSQNVIIGNSCASDVSSIINRSIIMGDNALTSMVTSIPVYSSLFMGDNSGVNLGSGSTRLSNCIFLGTNAGEGVKTTSIHGPTFSTIGISDIVAIGSSSGKNADGYRNVFIGSSAGSSYVGYHNTMIGFSVGTQGGSGEYNVFIGDQVGLDAQGSSNTYIGRTAGGWVNGDFNVFLGYNAGRASSGTPRTESYRLRIGYNSLIYGEFNNSFVQINGSLTVTGTLTNKKGIFEEVDNSIISKTASFSKGLSLLNSINPFYFKFTDKDDTSAETQLGVNASELQKVLPELVHEDKDGQLSVNYAKLGIVAIEAIKEQQQEIETLKKELEAIKVLITDMNK